MTKAAGFSRKNCRFKDHRRNWFVVWGLLLCCWIWYHSAKMPITWLLQRDKISGYHRIIHRPRLSQEQKLEKDTGSAAVVGTANICSEGTCFWNKAPLVLENPQKQKQALNLVTVHESSKRKLKPCATVEEMGAEATSSTRDQDFALRQMIEDYFFEHGAQRLRGLAGDDFCRRRFVYGRWNEDGFGNEMYKLLTAAGLALLLNRSLIVGEDSSANPRYLGLSETVHLPFGDYIAFSNESFTMREVKHLWVKHNCVGKYKRPLSMRIDSIQRPSGSYSLCDDWRTWSQPIIWFHGAQDAVALQLFLKNMHPGMKAAAARLLGEAFAPSTRGNLYGELLRAFISPKPVLEDAVQWTLGDGRDPDIALHLRMLNSRSGRTVQAACSCIKKVLSRLNIKGTPRIVIVTDTPAVLGMIRKNLEAFAEVIFFDYQLYLNSSEDLSNVMRENYFQPPRSRVDDWGPLPRWVALVDFFLASKAKHGVISAGAKRVATTYAQLVASLAAANNLGNEADDDNDFRLFSSFHPALLNRGLLQRGWGHAWRTFSGRLSCTNQTTQCAVTPLHPHAWWDGPLQLPTSRDAQLMRSFGISFNRSGIVIEKDLERFCSSRKRPRTNVVKLELPSCNRLKIC